MANPRYSDVNPNGRKEDPGCYDPKHPTQDSPVGRNPSFKQKPKVAGWRPPGLGEDHPGAP